MDLGNKIECNKLVKCAHNSFDKFSKFLPALTIISIVFLAIHLIFYTFVSSRAFINSDSTFIVDYSVEILKTGKIFPRNWVNTNDFWIYSLIPLITVFLISLPIVILPA